MDLFVRDDLPARGASDGVYSSDLNAYILPPLVGLPFDDMRANGEGARHQGDKHYYNLIVVHAVFMCLGFLLFIPLAIFQARFRAYKNPRRAIKAHIFSNVMTILSVTVGFVCTYLAVGKNRSWTNPHHIIGLTIYCLIMLQALLGIIVHHRGKYKVTPHIPLRTMLHRWLGRAIWLLGLAQIPLGLTLYGSPLVLFVLFAIWTFFLLIAYFISEFHRGRHHTAATVTTDTGYDYDETHDEKTERTGFFKRAAEVGLGIFAAKKVKDAFSRREEHDVESRQSRSSRQDGSRRRDRTPDQDYTYAADTRTQQSPGVKTGLLAGLLASGSRRKQGRIDTRPDSPSARKPGFFGGVLGRRQRTNLDMSMGASPKKKRIGRGFTGDGGWFASRRRAREDRQSVTDLSTGYDSDYDSTALGSRLPRGARHEHTTRDELGAAAAGAAVGGLAAAHHNRRSRRNYSPSDDSYMYSEVDRAQDRIHSMPAGGLQPPPAAQNGGYNNSNRGASTITSVTNPNINTRGSNTNTTNTNTRGSEFNRLAGPAAGAAVGAALLDEHHRNVSQTQHQNPNFYTAPDPVTLQDSAAQYSTSHLPPISGNPPIGPIPMPPEPYRGGSRPNSYRLHQSGSSSRRGSASNTNRREGEAAALAAGAAATGLGIIHHDRNRSRDRADYSDSDLSHAQTNTLNASAAGRAPGYRRPSEAVTSEYEGSVGTDGQYRPPQASLQVRIKKEDNGRTVTTIKRMPNREEGSVASPTGTNTNVRRERGEAGMHIREEKRRSGSRARGGSSGGEGAEDSWRRSERQEEGEEEELRQERDQRRERRRRRKTLDTESGGEQIPRPNFT